MQQPLRAAVVARVPTLAAAGGYVIGTAGVVRALLPHRAFDDLNHLVPATLLGVSRAAEVGVGVLLALLASGLRRRKRAAHVGVCALLLGNGAFHLAVGLHVVGAAVELLAGLLLALRWRDFPASGDPRTRVRALGVLVGLGVLDVALGWVLVRLREDDGNSVGTELRHVVEGLVGITGPLDFTSDRASAVVAAVLPTLGGVTLLTTAWLLLRPYAPAPGQDVAATEQARALLDRQGERDSLGYFALRDDKQLLFSASGKAAVAYRVVSGVMLASGDPLGDPEAWPGAIEAFQAEARRHAWLPAVLGCGEAGAEAWARHAGAAALELGDEAVIDVATFSLEGRAMRNVRQMVRRVQRAGYCTRVVRVADLEPAEAALVAAAADRWRGSATERGFSMALGRCADPRDPGAVVALAEREGQLAAVLQLVPWGRHGLSLDLMRRDPGADPGLNELLIVAVLQAAAELEVSRVSLNFAVFRSALDRGRRIGAGPVLRLWCRVLLIASKWFQIESLFRFNAKFGPRWEPRFVVYPSAGDLPHVLLAALEAEAFVVRPELRFFQKRRA
ncbi:lysyl-tRNA synthetase class 2 [Motilibacter rhizosphaerae]|uniref:Lysyl-tRNA synthetase class 2 n=1 Tax=Motilibacter rhizosphaerae TaxID=598652 RepID=A0A4Q7NSZ6_9ACTN|nr:phosphatidylglycerol lysyltransferase domain-containing protein [Motilibacter rhizosphaerae]RZS90273.1 lysyl-tRNA synthetase class 2 [Motilibacter rhizosphaerae]